DTKIGAFPEQTIRTQMPTRRDVPAKKPAPEKPAGAALTSLPPQPTTPYGKAVTRTMTALPRASAVSPPPPDEEPVVQLDLEDEAPPDSAPDPEEIVVDDEDEPI